MRASPIALSAFLLLSVLATGARGDWVHMPGPRGIQINALYKTGSTIYAGTQTRGVYRSADNGATWQAANGGLEHTTVTDIIEVNGALLAGVISESCGLIGVYRSTDGGNQWNPTSGLDKIVSALVIKGTFVYAVVTDFNSAIYRSSDDGQTWQQVPSPINEPSAAFASGNALIVSEGNFIFRTIDDGVTWDVVEQFALSGVYSFALSGNRILGAGLSNLYVSNDNGASWQTRNAPGGSAWSLSASGTTVFLGGANQVSKSTNAGFTWTDASAGLGRGTVRAILYDGTTVLAGTPSDTSGVYASSNGGTSWFPSSAGLPAATTIRAMAATGHSLFTGMEADGIYRSDDYGNSWLKVGLNDANLSNQLILAFCVHGGFLFAGTADGLYRSADNGDTFDLVVNGFPTGGKIFISSLTVSGNNIVAGASVQYPTMSIDTIFYSSDDGDSWQPGVLPPVDPTFISCVASDGSSTVYAGLSAVNSANSGLYRSTNGGVSWTLRVNIFDIDVLAVNGSNVLVGTLFDAFFSANGGLSFFQSDPAGGGVFTYSLANDVVFAGNEVGMNYSTTQGALWIDANPGFQPCPRPVVLASCTHGAYLFAGTEADGVWRIPLSDFAVTAIGDDPAPLRSQLSNYPNPFNPSTVIHYVLRADADVHLTIYDALGRTLRVLVAGRRETAGVHEIAWDGRDDSNHEVASGVYFCRLQAGPIVQSRRMTLLK